MKRSIKKLVAAIVVLVAIVAVCVPAHAGKGGFGGGMSRGGMGGGMSFRSSGGGMSGRNFASPARGMGSSSFSARNGVSSYSRNIGGNVSRTTGGSSLNGMNAVRNFSKGTMGRNGGFSDVVKSRGLGNSLGGKVKFNDVVKGRLGSSKAADIVRGRIGGSGSPFSKRTNIADSITNGKIRTGGASTIDRSKLRDLVRGIESAGGGRSRGDVGALVGVNSLGRKDFGLKHAFGTGAGFTSKKHHGHHHHWFDFCVGGPWYDPWYSDYCHDHYGYPSYPVYSYPDCVVTFGSPAPLEIVTVSDTGPAITDEANNLGLPQVEVAATEPVVDAPSLDVSTEAETTLGPTNEDSPFDVPTLDEPVIELASAKPVVQTELDLELTDVEMVDAGDWEAKRAPRFKVTVRNVGKRDIEKFVVSLVACKDAELDSSSLHSSATVERLAAGEGETVEVTLPLESLSLNRDDAGRETPFKSLIAAVDSDERIHEGNEENNLTLIDRTSIKLASF
jgi:hypothetical protein